MLFAFYHVLKAGGLHKMKVTNFQILLYKRFHIPYFSSRYSSRSFLSLLFEANMPANFSQLNIFEEFNFWVSSALGASGLNVIVAIINIFIFSNAKIPFNFCVAFVSQSRRNVYFILNESDYDYSSIFRTTRYLFPRWCS